MKRQDKSEFWKQVNILCQLLGHMLSDLAEKGGFVGRVSYVENYVPQIPSTYCGWADAKVCYRDLWSKHWSDDILPKSKKAFIERYVERFRAGEVDKLPPIMVCVYDDGAVTIDGGRRCSALMRLSASERARVRMGAFIIDLRSNGSSAHA